MTDTLIPARDRTSTAPALPLALIREVEQTLYREARMLDDERLEEWLETLTEDIHYFMPAAEARFRGDKTDIMGDTRRMAWFNDDLETLTVRVGRLLTGTAWAEDPPTRYAHLVTNIEVEYTDDPDVLRVYSNVFAYRNRNEKDEDVLVVRREDLWRREAGTLKLAKRFMKPTWNVLLSKNLNLFL
jgi:ethylbenzene dioxygenase beta subunit